MSTEEKKNQPSDEAIKNLFKFLIETSAPRILAEEEEKKSK